MAKKVHTVGLMTDKEIAKLLGERVANERRVKDMDQEALATKAGVNISVIRALEQTGRCPLEKLIAIMRALGRVNVFSGMFDFDEEYRFLPHEEYVTIKRKQEAGQIRKGKRGKPKSVEAW